jgi:hypothetical protein
VRHECERAHLGVLLLLRPQLLQHQTDTYFPLALHTYTYPFSPFFLRWCKSFLEPHPLKQYVLPFAPGDGAVGGAPPWPLLRFKGVAMLREGKNVEKNKGEARGGKRNDNKRSRKPRGAGGVSRNGGSAVPKALP